MRASALLLAFATLSAAAQNRAYAPDPAWQPPPTASARPNPLVGSRYAAGGRKLFQRNCASCHGQQGQGLPTKNAANLQLPAVQQQSDGALFWKISNGNLRRGMPAFSGLPEMQRWQIVLFLRTLAPLGEQERK